jgi:hypothetical protein
MGSLVAHGESGGGDTSDNCVAALFESIDGCISNTWVVETLLKPCMFRVLHWIQESCYQLQL